MPEPDLSRFVIVLCRAEEAGNVGSVCRAMRTMGLDRLVLAAPGAYQEERVAMMAVHAFDIYERARRFSDLAGALAGSSLSAGFTRRRGDRRKSFSMAVDAFADLAWQRRVEGDIALVFGNEQGGLVGEELDLCSIAVHIPTAGTGSAASLNLSQAVQIACWELRRQAPDFQSGSFVASTRGDIDIAVSRAALRLGDLGFFRQNQGEELRDFLRDISERAALSPTELRYFEAFIHKMASLAAKLT